MVTAQEESRSISENVTWGQRKRFADGKVSLPYSRFLGYDRSEDGLPQINEEEAKIVRLIYRLFLEGQTPHSIAKHLTEQGLTSPGEKEKWQSGTIRNILTNEKYKGDALLQKKYTVDFLTKKQKVNEGEVPQYYVENSHPAIIPSDVFDMVQDEMKQRKTMKNRHSSVGMFSSKIVCGECGGLYGSKVWHSNSKYRRVIFQCNNKFKGVDKCKTPHVTEDNIKKLFVTAVNKLISNKDEILENFEVIKHTIFDVTALETEHSEMKEEMSVVAGLIQKCVNENAQTRLDQKEYKQRYEGLVSRFEVAKARFNEIGEHQQKIKVRRERVEAFLCRLKEQDELIAEFDERLWHTLVETVTVFSEEDIWFTFKDGSEF
ncbi:recombinase family protein [Acetivibrio cellulolyticus]|uniref:recombinase family protein n=1 Tax=Acetivibrio cellulolyticus TaxID=35830 RepID=UPI0001E2E2A2|nr:recombinase family protein [Acetivibrio cellulolyticus]